MNKEELLELGKTPEFVSGIYNYCDRWCERCAFASRCFLYATEQADTDLDDPEVRDITNEKFWNKLRTIFQNTAEMISEWAAEAGVDLDSIDPTEAMAEHEREMEEAEQNELSQAARHYAGAVEEWFRKEFAPEENVYEDMPGATQFNEQDLAIGEAAEVIRWYQFFIAAKTFRAVSGINRIDEEDLDEDEPLTFDFVTNPEDDNEDIDYDAVIARSSRMDSNGSAKIAMVAIDRSIGAWRALQISLPEKSDTIKPMLIELDHLRRSLEARFPRARDFIRPGFDENLSELVS